MLKITQFIKVLLNDLVTCCYALCYPFVRLYCLYKDLTNDCDTCEDSKNDVCIINTKCNTALPCGVPIPFLNVPDVMLPNQPGYPGTIGSSSSGDAAYYIVFYETFDDSVTKTYRYRIYRGCVPNDAAHAISEVVFLGDIRNTCNPPTDSKSVILKRDDGHPNEDVIYSEDPVIQGGPYGVWGYKSSTSQTEPSVIYSLDVDISHILSGGHLADVYVYIKFNGYVQVAKVSGPLIDQGSE